AVAVRPCGETRAALLVPEAPWVAVEHRSLLSLITAGKLPPVDAAAIAYLPATLLQHAGIRADDVIDGWFEGLAQVFAVAETSLGRIATILLPRFDVQLYRDASELLALLDEAVQVASCIGAQVVSLTGLLPS